jgi:hypothetical protein
MLPCVELSSAPQCSKRAKYLPRGRFFHINSDNFMSAYTVKRTMPAGGLHITTAAAAQRAATAAAHPVWHSHSQPHHTLAAASASPNNMAQW